MPRFFPKGAEQTPRRIERGAADAAPGAAEQRRPDPAAEQRQRRKAEAVFAAARSHAEQEERGGEHESEEEIREQGDRGAAAPAERRERPVERAEPEPGEQRRREAADLRRDGDRRGHQWNSRAQRLPLGAASS